MNENSRSWRSEFRDWLLRNANMEPGHYDPGNLLARTGMSPVPVAAGAALAPKIGGAMLAADYGSEYLALSAGAGGVGGAAAVGGVGAGLVGSALLADALTPYSNDLTTSQAAADLYRVRHAGYLVPRNRLRSGGYLMYDDLDDVEANLHFEDRFPNGTGLGYRARQGRSDVLEALARGSTEPAADFGMGGGNIGGRMKDTLGPDFRDISGVRKPGSPMDLATRALETDEDRALRELLDREARDLYHEKFFGTGAYDPSRIRTAFEAAAAAAYRKVYGNRFVSRDPDGDPYAEEEFAPPDLMKDPNYYLSGKNVSPALVDLYATARKKGLRSVPVFKVPDWFRKKFKWEIPDGLVVDFDAEERLKQGKPLEFGPEPPAWWPDELLPPASMTGESHGTQGWAQDGNGPKNKTPDSGVRDLLPKKRKDADRDPRLDERPETVRQRAIDATHAANLAGDSDMNLYRQFYGDKTEDVVLGAKKARASLAGVFNWVPEEFDPYKKHNLDGMPIVLPRSSPWVNTSGSLSRFTAPVAFGDIFPYDEALNKPFATSGYYSVGQMNAGGRAHVVPASPGKDPVVWLPPEHADLRDPVARHELAHPGNPVANPLMKDPSGHGIDWYLDNMETTGPGVYSPDGWRVFNYHWDNPNEFAAAYANIKRAVGTLGEDMPDDFDAFIQDKFGDMLKGRGTQTDIEKLSSRIDRRLDELGIPRVDAGDLIRQYIFIRELDPEGSLPGLRKIAEKYGADPGKTIKAFGTKEERDAVWNYMRDILMDKDFLHSILKSERRGAGGNDSVHADARGGEAGSETEVPEPPVSEPAPQAQGGPRIVINPTTFHNQKDALCVAFNEGFRLWMEANDFQPQSEPTDRQRRFFSDTAYADDELQLRRTILARIATFDTSVKDPTDDQLSETAQFLDGVLESGWCKNEWEQDCVSRLSEAVKAAIGAEPVEPKEAPLAPAQAEPLEPAGGEEVQALQSGGSTDDEEEDRFALQNSGRSDKVDQAEEADLASREAGQAEGADMQPEAQEQAQEPAADQGAPTVQPAPPDAPRAGETASPDDEPTEEQARQAEAANEKDLAAATKEYNRMKAAGQLDAAGTPGGAARPKLTLASPVSPDSPGSIAYKSPRKGDISQPIVGSDSPGSIAYSGPRNGDISQPIVGSDSPGSISGPVLGYAPGSIESPVDDPRRKEERRKRRDRKRRGLL